MPLNPMPAADLVRLQTHLKQHGFNLGTTGPQSDGVDGDWGPSTDRAFDLYLAQSRDPADRPPAAPAAPVPSHIPLAYSWLKDMPTAIMPRTIWCGVKELGVKELAGGPNSPTIMAWAAEVGLRASYTADSVPWCGLFAALIVTRAGKVPVTNPLWALNWAKFGVDIGQPGLGDILTFQREGGGHVGFYVAEDTTAYHVLGGNQSDSVSITRIDKKRLYRARRPVYNSLPLGVKPYIVASTGALSTNEA